MDVFHLIKQLKDAKINVSVVDGKLKTSAPKGAITSSLAESIKDNKEALIALLQRVEKSELSQHQINAAPKQSMYPLSYAQQRLWFIDQLEGSSAQYNLSYALGVKGNLDEAAMHYALTNIIARHQVLRTTFVMQQTQPMQRVSEQYDVHIKKVKLAVADPQTLFELIEQESNCPFDLANDLMLRCCIVEHGQGERALIFTMHHIASDGWSMGVLVKEFMALYEAYKQNSQANLPELPVQYFDFAYWQRHQQDGELFNAQLNYWRDKLTGLPQVHSLPIDKSRPAKQSYTAKRHTQKLDSTLLQALKRLASDYDISLFIVLQSAFAALNAAYSGEQDIVMGVPHGGRKQAQLSSLIGFFINTLVFRTQFDESTTFASLLAQTKRTALEAFDNDLVPFEQLIEMLNPERSRAYNPVCQIKFVLQNHDTTQLEVDDVEFEAIAKQFDKVRFDLDLTAKELENELLLTWTYKEDLFLDSSIAAMATSFSSLLSQMVSCPDTRLVDVNYVNATMQPRLLQLGCGEFETAQRQNALVKQIEQQSKATPNATAVKAIAQNGVLSELSYNQLNTKAGRLAAVLLDAGVESNERVGIYLGREIELLIALLAVHKIGACYVILSLDAKMQRLQHIMQDADVGVVLRKRQQGLTTLKGVDSIYLDDAVTEQDWLSEYPVMCSVDVALSQSAYVLYTSGSTGMPKGVEVTHRGMNDYCQISRVHHFAGLDSLVASAVTFDMTLPGLFVPLLQGGCVNLLAQQDELTVLADTLVRNELGGCFIRLTPSHIFAMLPLLPAEPINAPHQFVIGGERFTKQLAVELQQHFPHSQIFNHYGPTETVVGATCFDVSAQLAHADEHLPIGRPLPNTQLLVLDEQQRLVPRGMAGELYIGGARVAKHYLNRPELSAKHFVAHPFKKGERLYRTGDKVRWLSNDNLSFLGRIDEQVKIRGHRIELGEVEQQLLKINGVAFATTKVWGTEHSAYIAAYLCVDPPLASETIAAQLAQVLPDYMLPSAWVFVEQLPRTGNGKVDKAQLPEPQQTQTHTIDALQSETELRLAEIWRSVLGQQQIGRQSEFFVLGGHSLLATRVASDINHILAKKVAVAALFEYPRLCDLADFLDTLPKSGFKPIERVSRSQPLPVSFAQQRLWFIEQLEGGSAQYNMPFALRLKGQLSIDALQSAITQLIIRHEILRTCYVEQDGQVQQIIHEASEMPITLVELSHLSGDDLTQALRDLAQQESTQLFDLRTQGALRVTIANIAANDHALYITLHHIASDGWSNGIIIRELCELYRANRAQQQANLQPLDIQYADYAMWQRTQLGDSSVQRQLDYWQQQLSGAPAVHSLPLDYPRPAQQRFTAKRHDHCIDGVLATQLHEFSLAQGTSLFMLLQSVFTTLLAHCSGEKDIVVGTPNAGRNHKHLEPLVGFFINTLVLRTSLVDNPSFVELLARTRQTALAAYEHQDIPFDYLVDVLKPERSLSYSPIFQVLFTMRNNDTPEFSLEGVDVTGIAGQQALSKFDIQLAVEHTSQGITTSWLYNTSLFSEETIAKWSSAYEILLQKMLQSPDESVFAHSLLDQLQRTELLNQAKGVTHTMGRAQSLIQHFEAQVLKTPDAQCVTCGVTSLTYRQLNEKANRLGRYVLEHTQGQSVCVGIHLGRSVELLIALLAIQKSAASYVILPQEHTSTRLNAMIDEAHIQLALVDSCNDEIDGSVSQFAMQNAATDSTWLQTYASDNLNRTVALNDTAYVLYTSGSTGKPKGVEVSHLGLVDYCLTSSQIHCPPAGSVVASNIAFDLSIPGLYAPLISGGCVTLIQANGDLEELAQCLMNEDLGARLVRLTPSHLRGLLPLIEQCQSSLAHSFVVGGERFDASLAFTLRTHFPQAKIYNHYGPTETVVGATCYELPSKATLTSSVLPIGKPLPNTSIYVLNESYQLVPVGMPGELYIGGLRVAKGYLKQPELSAAQFIENPFVAGERLYRTGDKVRWLPCGNLAFIGRLDSQVKVRGYRIELGDIEQHLIAHPDVEQVVVRIVDVAEQQILCAYVVSRATVSTQVLQAFLQQSLPHYMIPTCFEFLTTFPLTANGKVNTKALPKPSFTQSHYVAPRTQLEKQLVAIWQGVLNLENVGIEDNFFAIGGDSVMSIQVVSRAAKAGLSLSTRQLFECQTIAQLAAKISDRVQKFCEQGFVSGECALLPIQKNFLQAEHTHLHHFNQAVLLEVPTSLQACVLPNIVTALLTRHDALRLRFKCVEQQWQAWHQRFDDDMLAQSYQVETISQTQDFTHTVTQRCEYWQTQFDLEQGPLFRVVFFEHKQQSRLLLVAHHIVVDAVSWRVILADLEQAYQQVQQGLPVHLGVKTSSFSAFANQVVQWANSDVLVTQREYWLKQLEPSLPVLPKDRETCGHGSQASTQSCGFELSTSQTARLLEQANQTYHTQINELLLSGVLLGVYNWTGNQGVRIKLEGHGREDLFEHLDTTETVGWFTTHYPLALHSEDMRTSEVIKAVKEQVRAVPMRGFGFGALQMVDTDFAWTENNEPSFTFNYLGQINQGASSDVAPVFGFAPERHGATSSAQRTRRHGLIFKGLVANGQLQVSFQYSDEQYDQQTMQSFVDHLRLGIETVLEHCCQLSNQVYTPSDFPLAHVTQHRLDQLQEHYPQLVRLYPATPMQSGLYFHAQIDKSSYVTQHYPILKGDMDVNAFKQAWQYIIKRHDTFRTVFVECDQALHQLVNQHAILPWQQLDWRDKSQVQQRQDFAMLRAHERAQGVDFGVAPLMRVVLIRLTEDSYQLLWSHHHILSDGWSLPLLFKELMQCYQALSHNQQPVLKPAPIYENYMVWLAQQSKDQALVFWRDRLSHIEAPTPLVIDKLGTSTERQIRSRSVTLDQEAFAALQVYAQRQRVTINTLIQLAWAYLLHRYSQEPEVVIGVTLSGRPAQVDGIEELVGLFINSIPFNIDFAEDVSLETQLQQIQMQFQACSDHAYLSLVDIQKQSKLRAGTQLFDNLLVISNYPIEAASSAAVGESGLEITDNESYEETTYKLSLSVGVRQQIHIQCKYPSDEFSDLSIDHLLNDFSLILTQLPMTEGKSIQALHLSCDAVANSEKSLKPLQSSSVVKLFEHQAQRHAEQVAACFDGEQMSYGELNAQANKLARFLIESGVTKETLVGLSVERSIEMLIGMLAILKAGGAYVPLDPDYPQERLSYMILDAGIDVVLTQQSVMESLSIFEETMLIPLDLQFRDAVWGGYDASDLAVEIAADQLAYVIYTSGSTGQPKGVMVEHANIVRLVSNTDFVSYELGKVMAQASNASFDAATFEVWGALSNGMTLHYIAKDTLLDPQKLSATLAQHDVAILFVTTAILNQMSLVAPHGFATLDYLLFGGEAVDNAAVERILTAGKPAHFVHVYGPTENTTFSTAFEICHTTNFGFPIGQSINGSSHYVLDERMRPVPMGTIGELYLAGYGVARGYMNQPQLSAQRFVPDHFTQQGNMYRSGDMVRVLPSGDLLYVGRMDDQVKIRGFRIELGEVENSVLTHPEVNNACVVAKKDSLINRLVGYIVLNESSESYNEHVFVKALQSYLKQSLPDYMVPAVFVVMNELPLNANGKIDKSKLPEPNFDNLLEYVPPSNEVEVALTQIWQDVLRLEQVGVNDNFFEIGGDSILSIQVVSRANEQGVLISTKQLFESQTIAQLASVAGSTEEVLASQHALHGQQTLMPIHHYFLSGDEVARHHFNQTVLLKLPEAFSSDVLMAIMAATVARHDALRLSFTQQNGRWIAHYQSLDEALLDAICITETVTSLQDIEQRSRYWQTQFSLETGPLIRAVYFDCSQLPSEQSGRLLLAVHHIVVDGVSWRVLLKDIEMAFAQYQLDGTIKLPAKTSSYQLWADRLEQYALEQLLPAEKSYWLSQCGDRELAFKTDYVAKGTGKIASTKRLHIGLSSALTNQLIQQCNGTYRTTINELLLAAVYLGISQWQPCSRLTITLEGHGRENLFNDIDLTQTVGWFTSIYPLTLHATCSDVGEMIKAIKEQYRAIPNNGIGYGLLRYLAQDSDIIAAADQHLPQLMFNYLGQFDQVVNEQTQFQVADESIGPQVSLERQRAALLTLTGKVVGGQLQFSLAYSSEHYADKTMYALSHSIEIALEKVIEHCTSQDKGSFTPSDFPLANISINELDELQQRYNELDNLYPATPMQSGLYFEYLLDKSSYTVQIHPIIRGELNITLFRQAWQDVVQRYDILRTAFVGDVDSIHQMVLSHVNLQWQYIDWRHLSEDEQRSEFERFKVEDRNVGFEFTNAPLCRWYVIQLNDNRYQILWTLHHILLDGWSIPVVYRDVLRAYQARLDGCTQGLDVAPSYAKYVQWLKNSDVALAEQHWRDMLGEFTHPTPLIIEPASVQPDNQFNQLQLQFTEQQTHVLQGLAQQQKTTINTLLQWAWGYLLHSYSGESDVVFGATISGRPAEVEGIEQMVGMFINTIPVKASFATSPDIASSIQVLQQSFQTSNQFGYLSLLQIQKQSAVRLGQALFDSLLVFENYPIDAAMRDDSQNAPFEVESLSNTEHTTFKLSVIASLRLTLNIKLGYRADLFDKESIERLLQHFKQILLLMPQALEENKYPVFISQEEYALHQRLQTFKVVERPTALVHQQFEQCVEAYPNNTALWHDDQTKTYQALNEQANRLAHYLQQQGVQQGDFVGICFTRSLDVIVAILAILKSGGAYIPLDPAAPQSRIEYIANDSGFELLLTSSALAKNLATLEIQTMCLDEIDAQLATMSSNNITLEHVDDEQLIYIIYTSGTTGNPKGVLVTHNNVARLFSATTTQFKYSQNDVWTLFHSTAFDASVWEIWGALLHGGKLVIPSYAQTRDPAAFLSLCQAQQVTSLTQTPSAFKMLSQTAITGDYPLASLQYIVMCGEALRTEDLISWWQHYEVDKPAFINMYGITETTVHSTYKHITPTDLGSSNIGLALSDLPIYLLDGHGNPVPQGVAGEIYVGGCGVARGYLNKPQLSAERFIDNPFASEHMRTLGYTRMYKSGDLAKLSNNGELLYLGRNDEQVKIRGFRIELGEIESQLNLLPQVASSVVVAKQGSTGDNKLIAYVVAQTTSAIEEKQIGQLRHYLLTVLPDYMVPSAIIAMDAWPLTVNGKIDKQALPDADFTATQHYQAPQTDTEKQLAHYWSALLNLAEDEIGVNTSFFELGGHSLLVARLNSELNAHFAVNLSVMDIFANNTIQAQAKLIEDSCAQHELRQALSLNDMDTDNAQELIEL